MIGVRLNTFNDNSIGEPDQDANSALTELDKGLRSGKVGEQCEAIVRFPRLFEKYPFPILINSSFLKLSDVFRMGNNFLRLWVLRVCQQSEKHLDKILNVDEFLRRIFSVLHSNDPVARALALKTLGAVAGIIPERQNVHHAIRRGLDSHDNVEVDAAIYATTRFAAHSNSFAVAMCNKLSDMVECENTGPERRDKLVRALRTVHGGAVRAHGVLQLLRSLMERFPSSSSVRAAIAALTAIADDTVVHVPDQVELLLSIAVNEPRRSVRRAALLGLKTLAAHAALWPPACINSLVLAASARSDDVQHTMLCLQVMQILVKCPAVCAGAGSEAASSPSLLRQYVAARALGEPRHAATAADTRADILLHCYRESLPVDGSDLMLALESLVITTGLQDGKDNSKPLRIALSCMVKLSNAEPQMYAVRCATVLASQLQSLSWVTNQATEQQKVRLCSLLEATAALGGGTYCPESVRPAMPAVLEKLKQVAALAKHESIDEPIDIDAPPSEQHYNSGAALVLLCTIAMQERAGAAMSVQISPEWEQVVMDALSAANGWTRYRVAHQALRYGHHRLAARLLDQLASSAASEAAQRWLTALKTAADADTLLCEQGIPGLEEASSLWQVSGGAGGGWCSGCGGCGACAGMTSAWCSMRAQALAALSRTAAAARALCTQPPPATAHAHAQAARSAACKAGACATSLRRAARTLSGAADALHDQASRAFYADQSTLRHLQILQRTYNLLSHFVERISTSNFQEKQAIELTFSGKELQPSNLQEKIMLASCAQVEEISSKLFDNPTTKPGITHRHAEAVLAAVRACTRGALWPRDACLGRGGGARCRLSVSPAPRAPPADHAATLSLSHHLALKVEGVILPPFADVKESRRKKQEVRQVRGVQITVTATPHPRTNEKTVDLTNVPPVLSAVQLVTPVRDFFAAQQLVSVPAPGLYTVTVEAATVDQRNDLWPAHTSTSIVIKAHEDSSVKGTGQASRGRF